MAAVVRAISGLFPLDGCCQYSFFITSRPLERIFPNFTSISPLYKTIFRLRQQNPVLARSLGRFISLFFSIPSSFQPFFLENRGHFVLLLAVFKLGFHFHRNLRDSEIDKFSSLLNLIHNSSLSPLFRLSPLVPLLLEPLLCFLFLLYYFSPFIPVSTTKRFGLLLSLPKYRPFSEKRLEPSPPNLGGGPFFQSQLDPVAETCSLSLCCGNHIWFVYPFLVYKEFMG